MPQQYVRIGYDSVIFEIENCSAMFQGRVNLNNVLGLGLSQRCISIWELLSIVIRYGKPQQCVSIGYGSIVSEIVICSALY